MKRWLGEFLGGRDERIEPSLQVRLFRTFTATTALLVLGVVLPLSLLQNLPWGVRVADATLGVVAMCCYLISRKRGGHAMFTFFAVLVLIFNAVWFLNAGSDGSVPYYFFPAVLYPLAVFRGRWRWALSSFWASNFCALLILDHRFPAWKVPFPTSEDRLIDLLSGAVAALAAIGALVWLIIAEHEKEQRRITEYAAKLEAGEANYRAIFNGTSEALAIYDGSGRLIDANAHMERLFGCSIEELRAQPIGMRSLGVSPYTTEDAVNHMRRALQDGPQFIRWRGRRADGELFWSEISIRAADIGGQRRLIAALRDISPRLAVEEALRRQEQRLRLALAASNQGWFEINLLTGEGTASGEYARIIGLEPVEFKVTASGWLEGIHPDDREAAQREFAACVTDGVTRTMEYRRRTQAGTWKWIRSTGRIVERDDQGRPLRMSGTHADITERKMLEAQLLHSQRLESVGTLASGVAHDLNNILTPMLMVSSLLRTKLPEEEDRALMSQLEAGAKRGAGIVRQLLTFSRDLVPARSGVDAKEVIAEIMGVMRETFPREIELSTRVAEDLWTVKADPIQLHQVVLNLCINARDAMPTGGKLAVTAENVAPAAALGGTSGKRFVAITVSDTGHGILPEHRERIFDPFFSTKDVGKGTGLGLSTVHGIMKSHGGAVTVESEVGRGSRFRVTFPTSDVAPEAPAKPAELPQRNQSRPLVLVIDDERSVLQVSARVLAAEGCEVVSALGSDEALKLIATLRDTVKLAVTDMMMPGMDGAELVPRLRQACPGLKVIGVSGLDLRPRLPELRALGFVEVLHKPYDGPTLQAAVRRHLPDTRA